MMVPEMRSCRYQNSSPQTTSPTYVTSTTNQDHYAIPYGQPDMQHSQHNFQQHCDIHYYNHPECINGTYPQKYSIPQQYGIHGSVLRNGINNNNYGCYEKELESNQRCQSAEVSTSTDDNRYIKIITLFICKCNM